MTLLFASVVFAQDGKDFGTYKAREISRSDTWINGAPLTLKSLRGRVVVLDFWAFDCAPCIEAIPRIEGLYDKYGSQGLVVIGVHTPRADYEKDVSRLRESVTKMGIKYPVVTDNDSSEVTRDEIRQASRVNCAPAKPANARSSRRSVFAQVRGKAVRVQVSAASAVPA